MAALAGVNKDSGDSRAMIDSGACASAGGHAAVRDLTAAVTRANPAVTVYVDQGDKPWFRFGDGKWGRAMYRVELAFPSFKLSIYALNSPGVPVLLGMLALGGLGFTINLQTGRALAAGVYLKLAKNSKNPTFCLSLSATLEPYVNRTESTEANGPHRHRLRYMRSVPICAAGPGTSRTASWHA